MLWPKESDQVPSCSQDTFTLLRRACALLLSLLGRFYMTYLQEEILDDLTYLQGKVQQVSYCCQHVMILEKLGQQAYALHGLFRGRLLTMKVREDDFFEGMPTCRICAEAKARFVIGIVGNLIQKWTARQFRFQDLFLLMQISGGRFVTRAVPEDMGHPGGSGLLTPSFVSYCERHLWLSRVMTTINDTRPLVEGIAPFTDRVLQAEQIILRDLPKMQPFIRASASGVLLRILADDEAKAGLVGVSWECQEARNMPTFTGTIWVNEDETLMDNFRLVTPSPNPVTYIVVRDGQDLRYHPAGWVSFATWREIYHFIEAETGAGLLPFQYGNNGLLDWPAFYVQLL